MDSALQKQQIITSNWWLTCRKLFFTMTAGGLLFNFVLCLKITEA